MTKYLISFDDGAMSFPADELPAVSDASREVVREAKRAGVWVFGAGLRPFAEASVVAEDGAVAAGPRAGKRDHLSGFCMLEVDSREEAHEWAATLAAACRCSQEVREIMDDPDS